MPIKNMTILINQLGFQHPKEPTESGMRLSLFIALLASLFTVSAAYAQVGNDSSQFGSSPATASTSSSRYYDHERCTVQLIGDLEVPALETGPIKKILVKQGQAVNSQDVLVQLDDNRSRLAEEEAMMRHQVARERATDMTEMNTASKRYQLSAAEYSKSAKLRQSGSVSGHAANRARYSMEVAQLEYQGASNARKMAAGDARVEMVRVKASRASIERHKIKSPVIGNVVEIMREEGEWVTAGDTIMRIARMDRLKVPAFIDGKLYDTHEIDGRPVTVTLKLARDREVEFSGKVVHAEIERRQGNLYRVWAEIDNKMFDGNTGHWMLQPSSVVSMRIHLEDPPLQSASIAEQGGMLQN